MINIFFVFLGGCIGTLGRYFFATNYEFLVGTLIANLFGCFLLGLFSVLVRKRAKHIPLHLRLFLTAGLCGSLTTFSTFCFEVVRLMQNTEYFSAILYLVSSIITGLIFLVLGIEACRRMLKKQIDLKRKKLRKEFIKGE